ncbi:MAG TPA: YebC/PmpR family DNA-binding transcriptional regulator [Candidatus Desulfofervidus auxilii]|uniref:Probable transcriptional regulatory protein ENF30_01630 n=1 Tax=Desulfofervidus auxilii TaxID=1621989 RepID=A0A7V0NED6_DESA2|nr:YebC/PmpR family DNA-binding transcriptional regulator [Candidatus Desulfofervidus auxilii]
MAGHSKWAQIKRKKAAMDAKRGKIFTKLIREIMTAARIGGGDPNKNPRLRAAIEAAKTENMPKENIERAIKKGTGELEGINYEEVIYEGYGPGGIAVMISALTDNKNRTVSEIRYLFSKFGGNLGETGCVSWMFEKKGVIAFDKDKIDEEKLMEVAIEAGAEDVRNEEDEYEVITAPEDFEKVRKAFEDVHLKYERAEVTLVCQNTIKITDRQQAERILRFMEALEEHDDVQKVHTNFDIPEEIMEAEAA